MNKREFLAQLKKALSGLPQEDIDERLTFYSEMIDDQMEEGLSEDDAVAAVGAVDEIAAQVVADTPLAKIAKERIKPARKLHAWEILLLALGAPIWLSLGIAAAAVILSLYVVLGAAVLSLWTVFGALVLSAFSALVCGIVLAFSSNELAGMAAIGTACVCAGLSIFLFFGCRSGTKGVWLLTKKLALGIKSCFMKKEDAQ